MRRTQFQIVLRISVKYYINLFVDLTVTKGDYKRTYYKIGEIKGKEDIEF